MPGTRWMSPPPRRYTLRTMLSTIVGAWGHLDPTQPAVTPSVTTFQWVQARACGTVCPSVVVEWGTCTGLWTAG